VYESGCGAFVRRACSPGGDRVFADCRAGGPEPLFPLVWALWLMVGVEQQPPAERAAAVLGSQEQQHGRTEWGWVAATPQAPVVGQGRVVWGRRSCDHPVPEIGVQANLRRW
jgi:hypothetical protein